MTQKCSKMTQNEQKMSKKRQKMSFLAGAFVNIHQLLKNQTKLGILKLLTYWILVVCCAYTQKIMQTVI